MAQPRPHTFRPVIFFMALFSIILVSENELLSSEAHFVAKNTQQWESKQGNVLIQFAYEPERPIIDTFTELKFNIQNLSTGQHLENLTRRVVVTNGQRLFNFENEKEDRQAILMKF